MMSMIDLDVHVYTSFLSDADQLETCTSVKRVRGIYSTHFIQLFSLTSC
jgi:hypothetical protein